MGIIFCDLAKHFERHFLLSGDAEGAIILWELCLEDKKVLIQNFSCLFY